MRGKLRKANHQRSPNKPGYKLGRLRIKLHELVVQPLSLSAGDSEGEFVSRSEGDSAI